MEDENDKESGNPLVRSTLCMLPRGQFGACTPQDHVRVLEPRSPDSRCEVICDKRTLSFS